MTANKIENLRTALFSSWSNKSSTLWKAECPALGQCGVTALVAQDILGGDILKTPFDDIWHYYNRIDGKNVDFTESQFDSEPNYLDIVSDRVEAFSDTNQSQYNHLKAAVKRSLVDDYHDV